MNDHNTVHFVWIPWMRYHSNVFSCDAIHFTLCQHPTYDDCSIITRLGCTCVDVQPFIWGPMSVSHVMRVMQIHKANMQGIYPIALKSLPSSQAPSPQSNQPTTFEGIFLTYSPHRPHNKLSKIALKGMARRMAYSAVHWEGGALGGLRPTTPTGCHLLV